MPGYTSVLNEVTPLDESHSAFGTEPGHNVRLVVLRFVAALPSLRISNSQIFRQVLPMPLFSSAFMGMAGRFSCHRTMPKQADRDLGHNFFWKNALSFRNISLTGSKVQKQSPSNSHVPVRQSASSFRTVYPMNALGNQGVMFSDPLLRHLEDRISVQLAQQPFRHEDLQIAVSNPRLDASLLPLKQSDMCLVCIAFASWVLKTTNPQVGDAWKAVLLANVSALSAIRYLRKYVKTEAATSEMKLNYTESSDS
ncbi:PGC-1 and ERR-induced regulator in muscle protein 1 [Nibea albiflora]|uniref:PGC-1 and ERR-induced regulator in muscle protein 1 n=1 Tax=Nibea albiflora TaxID=240163 RepID=A0ACB7ELK6_NIBAL|nr:PGC-1 and ERR-induced regulator in muscle protein 1 [Nibea albiflora]